MEVDLTGSSHPNQPMEVDLIMLMDTNQPLEVDAVILWGQTSASGGRY
jgi:hypothetical protein